MWRMAFAFANLGIPGAMVLSKNWTTKHRPQLVTQLVALLLSKENPAGILLNEVGNLTDLLKAQEREEFEAEGRGYDNIACGTSASKLSGLHSRSWRRTMLAA